MSHNTHSVLARAAEGALYAAKAPKPTEEESEESGGGGGETPEKIELTQQEIDERIATATEAARKEEREKLKKKAKKKQAEETVEEEEEAEDPDELVRAAEARAAEAEQRAAAAERKEKMAEVKDKLRDYLALNFKEFVGNAPDILLHIEKALSPDPKDAEIARLIESHAKAFVERTKGSRGSIASGAPVGGIRRGATASNTTITREERRQSDEQPERRFAAINWHG